jgi:hypothetical protein
MSNAKKWGVAFVAALAVAVAAVCYPRASVIPESAGPIDKDGKLRLFDEFGTFRNTESGYINQPYFSLAKIVLLTGFRFVTFRSLCA